MCDEESELKSKQKIKTYHHGGRCARGTLARGCIREEGKMPRPERPAGGRRGMVGSRKRVWRSLVWEWRSLHRLRHTSRFPAKKCGPDRELSHKECESHLPKL